MPGFINNGIWYGSIVLLVIAAVRLLQLRAAGRYPLLGLYLAFSIAREGLLVFLWHSQARWLGFRGHSLVYITTEPVLWGLYFLVVLELFSRMLEDYHGIRRFGRMVLFSALAGAALAYCALIFMGQQAGYDRYPALSELALLERSVFLCLSALLLALLGFVVHFRVSIPHNVWVLCASLGGYFLLSAALLTLRRHFGEVFAALRNLSNGVFFFVALLGTVLFLSKEGESGKSPIGALWGRRDLRREEALALQLRSFNQVLAKVLRQ